MENLKSEWVFRRSLTRWNLTVPFIGMFTHARALSHSWCARLNLFFDVGRT